MIKVIHKHVIEPDRRGKCEITMPENAVILSVQMQHGKPMLWVTHEPDSFESIRHFRVVMTGEEYWSKECNYLGTVQDGPYVIHVFEDRFCTIKR